jgi:hypothetical protein
VDSALPLKDKRQRRLQVSSAITSCLVECHREDIPIGWFDGEKPRRLGPTGRRRHGRTRWRAQTQVRDLAEDCVA